MSEIPITLLTAEGVELDAAIASTGNDWFEDNDGFVVIEITNPTGGQLTCSFIAQYEYAGLTLPPREVIVPASSTIWSRPLPPAVFNTATGAVYVEAAVGLLLRGLRF